MARRAQQELCVMYPRQQTARPTQRSDRSSIIGDHRAETLRPVALPALAAAVQAASATRKPPRAALLTSARSTRFEHEDTPLS